MNLKATLSHVTTNWKSSLSGLMSAIIGFSAVASTPNPWIPSSIGIKILGAAAIAKVILGLIQTDGTHTTVNLPANSAPMQVNIPPSSTVTTTVSTPEKP
jgi:hypothetical protein